MGLRDWSMDAKRRSPYQASTVVRYGAVVAVAASALELAHIASQGWKLRLSFTTFDLVLVMVAAWIGGIWPGVLSTLACTLITAYFWAEPTNSLAIYSTADLVSVGLFTFLGVTISVLCEQLHAARRNEHRARVLREEMLAIVAHDLKNPLGAVYTALALLDLHAASAADGAKLRAPTATIRRMAMQMDHLIRDLLDAAAIEAGAFNVVKAPEGVNALLRDALEPYEEASARKGVALTLDACKECPKVHCDRTRVLQALSNLIANAVKFTPDGGTVRVRADAVDGGVRFSVIDTGSGIAVEQLSHIFDRYWHGTRRAGAETGLGLYIAQGIVQAHGGCSIVVTSQPGEGSNFSFILSTVPDELV